MRQSEQHKASTLPIEPNPPVCSSMELSHNAVAAYSTSSTASFGLSGTSTNAASPHGNSSVGLHLLFSSHILQDGVSRSQQAATAPNSASGNLLSFTMHPQTDECEQDDEVAQSFSEASKVVGLWSTQCVHDNVTPPPRSRNSRLVLLELSQCGL